MENCGYQRDVRIANANVRTNSGVAGVIGSPSNMRIHSYVLMVFKISEVRIRDGRRNFSRLKSPGRRDLCQAPVPLVRPP
jgi:hypothetical protein